MTFRQHTTDELNTAINIAARQMTTTPASPELRAKVMARIAVQPRWGWRLAFAGGALGAAALTAAVMWPARHTAVPAPVDLAATAASAASAALALTSEPANMPPLRAEGIASTDVVIVRMPRRTVSAFAVPAGEAEWRTRALPALETPDPLHVAPLQHADLTVAPIEIAPLTVPPLSSTATSAGGSK